MERQLERIHLSHLIEQRMNLMQERANLMAQITRIDHQLIGINVEIAEINQHRMQKGGLDDREGIGTIPTFGEKNTDF